MFALLSSNSVFLLFFFLIQPTVTKDYHKKNKLITETQSHNQYPSHFLACRPKMKNIHTATDTWLDLQCAGQTQHGGSNIPLKSSGFFFLSQETGLNSKETWRIWINKRSRAEAWTCLSQAAQYSAEYMDKSLSETWPPPSSDRSVHWTWMSAWETKELFCLAVWTAGSVLSYRTINLIWHVLKSNLKINQFFDWLKKNNEKEKGLVKSFSILYHYETFPF